MPTPVSLRLPPLTVVRLGKCSDAAGIPQSELIRAAIFAFLENNHSPVDVITAVAQYRKALLTARLQKRLAR